MSELKEQPLVTVVVPIYKTEKYLEQCVNSILHQTFEDFELILVDDGSPDNCPKMCDEFKEKDNRISVVHKKNGGSVSARQAGVQIAKGVYVTFLDSDDWIGNNWLCKAVDEINANHPDIVSCSYSSYTQNDDGMCSIIPRCELVECGYYDKIGLENYVYPKMISSENFFEFGCVPALWTKFIKKSLLSKPQYEVPCDITIGEDAAVSYRCMLNANSVSVIDNTEYYYRQNNESITHKYDENCCKRVNNLLDYLLNTIGGDKFDINSQLERYALMLLLWTIDNERKASFSGKKIEILMNNEFIVKSIKLRNLRPFRKNIRSIVKIYMLKFHLIGILKKF